MRLHQSDPYLSTIFYQILCNALEFQKYRLNMNIIFRGSGKFNNWACFSKNSNFEQFLQYSSHKNTKTLLTVYKTAVFSVVSFKTT